MRRFGQHSTSAVSRTAAVDLRDSGRMDCDLHHAVRLTAEQLECLGQLSRVK